MILRTIHFLALVLATVAQTSPLDDAVPTVKLPEAPSALMNPDVPTVTLPEAPIATPVVNEATSVPTLGPTPSPNECSFLEPGDVNVIIFNSDPLDQIVFFTLKDLGASVGSLFVTDRAWDGQDFVTDEGILEVSLRPVPKHHVSQKPDPCHSQYIIPEGGIKAGSTFGYGVTFPGQNGEWLESDEEVLFDLSTVGSDSMLVYCLNANAKPVFLSAVTYNDNGFAEPGKVSYNTGETALPETLKDTGSLSLPFAPYYLYKGPLEGKRDALLLAFSDPSNFQGSLVPFAIDTSASSATYNSVSFGVTVAVCILVARM